jgi:hypothetical protein
MSIKSIFWNLRQKDNLIKSIDAALPVETVVHGVIIKEQPTRAYLETVRRMGGMLIEILDTAFPNQTPGQVFTEFLVMTPDGFRDMTARLLTVVPEKTLAILASIMGTTLEHLRDDLSPTKVAQVCVEFWKVNDLKDFFQIVRGNLAPLLSTLKQNGGFSASLPTGEK